MRLEPGTRLGRFEVLSPLGEGGMGEVYLAIDQELGRRVALKVLPLASDERPERIERFEREARILASLSHPHIGSIFGFERIDDLRVLVLELVPGRTLDLWLRERPGMNEIFNIFIQIAEGLEAAHSRGIVHRDLKPANIKITPSGAAKILDFGLADSGNDAFEGGREGETLELPGATAPASAGVESGVPPARGRMVGTLPYMSPEQVRGFPVDGQSDVWAYGCLLYEALAGRRAFPGESGPDVLSSILHRDPDWKRLPGQTPPRLMLLLQRCLSRNPHRRLHSVADARIELQEMLDDEPGRMTSRRPRHVGWAAVAVLALFLLALFAFIVPSTPRPPELPVPVAPKFLEIGLSEDAPVWLWFWRPVPALDLSPDARRIVYTADRGLGTQLYLRRLDIRKVEPLEGTEEARHPFFSPDGSQIAFFSENELLTLDLDSGRVDALAEVMPESSGGSWADDGFIYYTPNPTSGILRVSAAGGVPQPVTQLDPDRKERAHLWPEVLPDSAVIVYNAMGDAGLTASRLIAESMVTGKRTVLAEGGAGARYLEGRGEAPGQIVYADRGKLLVFPFDVEALRPLAAPRTLIDGVRTEATGAAQYSLAGDGTLVFLPGTAELGDRTLVWGDEDGQIEPLSAPRRNYHSPRLSPDGRRIAVEINEAGRFDVWVYDVERSTLSRLTFEGNNFAPVWSPNGRRIAFVTDRQGRYSLMEKPFDDSTAARELVSSEHSLLPSSWSPDGRYLAYYARHPERQLDLWVWSEETKTARVFLATSSSELKPMFSPDGRWIAFSSDRTGRREVYVAPFPEGEPVTAISLDGGRSPVWNREGTGLYYRSGDDISLATLRFKSLMEFGELRVLENFEGEGATSHPRFGLLAATDLPGLDDEEYRSALAQGLAGGWIRAHPPSPGQRGHWRWQYGFVREQKHYALDLQEVVQPVVESAVAVFEASEDAGLADPDFDVAIGNRRLLMVKGAGEQQVADRLEVALGLLPANFPPP